MTLPGSHQNFHLRAHKCAELCVQPLKRLQSTELFQFNGRMQSQKQPQSPCICSHAFTLSYVMKWQNSSHLYCARFSKRAREPVLRKWSDAGMPCSEILHASPICQVSVPPSLLPFLAWKLLLNYVYFTIFVSWRRVRPQTPLDAIMETTWPNVGSITDLDPFVGAHPPLQPAAAPSFSFVVGTPPTFSFLLCFADHSSWCIFWCT
jgi:hypothetical protein